MDTIAIILEYISLGIGIIAFLIIVWGVVKSLVEFGKAYFIRHPPEKRRLKLLGNVRYNLGYHLLIALELLIAADIIRTIIKPTLEELGILGAIVAIRVVLSYFLHIEIKRDI